MIFGTLANDELKVAHLRAQAQGIQHNHRLAPVDPQPGQPVVLSVTTGPDLLFERLTCYYTTDGREPRGSLGTAQVGQAVAFELSGLEWNTLAWNYVRHWQVTLPPQPAGTLVRYRIGGFRQASVTEPSPEYWADWPPIQETLEAASAAFFAGTRIDQALADARADLAARGPDGEPTTFAYRVDDLAPPAWAHAATVYQVFLDRFFPGSAAAWAAPQTADGLPDLNGIWGGTLAGVNERLDYIAGLGATCLWLSPLFVSPTHHRYDATDYYRVEPSLGTADELRGLVQAAHARGLRVLLDYATNHISDRHPIFQAALADPHSPYRGWFHFDDSALGYRAFFNVASMPQLNTDHPAARRYLIDIATYWLREFDVDGFRLDYANGPTRSFWSDFWAACKALKPDCWCFGEVIEPPEQQITFAGRLDGCLDFLLNERVRRLFAQDRIDLVAFDRFLEAHERYFPDAFTRPSFLDNHDMDRFIFLAQGDTRRLELAALFLALLPQPWIIYAGSELGLNQSVSAAAGRLEVNRVPMPWQELDLPDRAARLATFRNLGRLRRDHPWLARGRRVTRLVDPARGLYAFSRHAAGAPAPALLAIFNLSQTAVDVALSTAGLDWPANAPLHELAGRAHASLSQGLVEARLPPLGGCALLPE